VAKKKQPRKRLTEALHGVSRIEQSFPCHSVTFSDFSAAAFAGLT
jgi:hypothetical protein